VAQKANLSFKNIITYISIIDEASHFKFGKQLGLAKSHHQIPLEEKLAAALGLGSSPKFRASPSFNITAAAEAANDFKFGTQLGFAKAHHKITSGGLGLGSSQKFWGSPIISLQRLGLAISNLASSWGLPKAHREIIRMGGHRPVLGELPKIWGFPFNIYTMAEARDFKLGFAKAHHKTTPCRRKMGVASG